MRLLVSILVLVVLCFGCRRSGESEYQGKTLRQWEKEAASEDAAKRCEAAKALGKIGPQGLAGLMPLLRDPNGHVRAMASLAMADMGPKAVPQLKELIHDPDPKVRESAAKALIQSLVNMRREGVRQLIELLDDKDPVVRLEAAKSFPRAGMAGKAAIPALKAMLEKEENKAVRDAAGLTLRIIESKRAQPIIRPAEKSS